MESIVPKDICKIHPFDSILQKTELEIIARNIIIIIQSRIANKFQLIDCDIYSYHRMKDGNFSKTEKKYFDIVSPLLTNEKDVRKFSKEWDINPFK
jgi:hypothetical protein